MAKLKDTVFHTAFDSFRYLDNIGSGGSGTVLQVENESGELFALKYLSPDRMTSEKLKRFKNELSFSAQNEHENIVKVLDWGQVVLKEKKCPFYVMPYYNQNLRELIKQGKLLKQDVIKKIRMFYAKDRGRVSLSELKALFANYLD